MTGYAERLDSGTRRVTAVAVFLVVWAACRLVFWTGYVGADDFVYGRYAFRLHRPPIDHREFRLPAILCLRASYCVFGATEPAACLPSLAASLVLMFAVAVMVDWPRKVTLSNLAAMLLAATMPLDVAMATYPGAPMLAAALAALGAALLLRGDGVLRHIGAILMALGFWTHEVILFLAGAVCLAALWQDRRRYLRPVLTCVAAGAGMVMVDAVIYGLWIGDPLARYRNAAHVTTAPIDFHARFGGSAVRFFLWPLHTLVVSKHFGLDLLLATAGGIYLWRRLATPHKILLAAMVGYWLWLGYGTQVPWAYRPRTRGMHYFLALTFMAAVLVPAVLEHFAERRRAWLPLGIVAALAVHLLALLAGGRWGQQVDVGRELLAFARGKTHVSFATDVSTFNAMHVLNGFQPPQNVVCLNGPAVRHRLLINHEPERSAEHEFPPAGVEALLINYEQTVHGVEPEFARFVRSRKLRAVQRIEPQSRPLFRPLARFLELPSWAVQSRGGLVAAIEPERVNQDRVDSTQLVP